MKDKKIIVLSIIGSLLLVSIAIASSYAYFVANVSGNKDTNNVVVTNGVMALEYKDGDEITLANAVPGNSVTKTFTVKNTGNVSTNYTIYFSELSNKFVDKTDLVYTLTSSDGGKSVAQTQVPDSNEAMVSNYAIEAGKTHTYTLTVTFLDKDENQDDNQNVSFSTKVTINETKEVESPSTGGAASTIAALATTDTTNFANDDPDNNIRYIGVNPNNYVYFNCSDYSNQSDSTCEKWRIIGVFKNVTKSDGTKEDLVKIIRDDRLNNEIFSWDYKKNGVGTSTDDNGSNDWTDSQLMMMLNPTDYLKSGYTIDNNVVKDSKGQAIYKNMGSYYNGTTGCDPASITSGSSFSCGLIDFTSTGLKNDLTRNAIESVVWNLGGLSSSSNITSTFYSAERGTTVYSDNATTWTGKVGLMYPSDYGYATSGNSTTDRTTCLAKKISSWSSASDCYNNDYLYKSSYQQWTLAPASSDANGVFHVNTFGYVNYDKARATGYFVRPVVFLKSNISITDVGIGTAESPFQLKVG